MSIAGIASNSGLFQNSVVQQTQNRFQQIQSQFQKLGQDLQSGNLTQAQSDFSTLSQELPNGSQFGASGTSTSAGAAGATSPTNSNPILQAFQSLGKDLQAGNLSAAQQDFANIQQSAQQAQASGQAHHSHHHHHAGGDDSNSNSPVSTLQQDFTSLGQSLQSGNLSSAQQAYASLQSDLQQFLPSFATNSSGTGSTSAAATTGVSVTA
ncbi:MAG TPA: hypothetical protein VHP80_13955 [Candidatus Acidoferrum sp.]|nr:hypothetical protein [Candidatus Acidoferrum sp.]